MKTLSEPMYDDLTLELIMEEERKDLVRQLWQYTQVLIEYVIRLRNRINELSENQDLSIPFPDPASDFIICFCDHPAYSEFSDVMVDEEPMEDLLIPY